MKSVRIRSYSGPYFSVFRLNTDNLWTSPYSVQMRESKDQNKSEYGNFLRSVNTVNIFYYDLCFLYFRVLDFSRQLDWVWKRGCTGWSWRESERTSYLITTHKGVDEWYLPGTNVWFNVKLFYRQARKAIIKSLRLQFVIFKPQSYCFEETIEFDVNVLFASRPVSRLIMWYNKRILRKGFSVPWDVSWIENYKLTKLFRYYSQLITQGNYC